MICAQRVGSVRKPTTALGLLGLRPCLLLVFQLIQNTTGHRSLDSLCCYERVSNEQQQASSRVLTARDPNVTYDMELSSVKSKSQNTHFAQSLQTGHQLSIVFRPFHGCSIGTINSFNAYYIYICTRVIATHHVIHTFM